MSYTRKIIFLFTIMIMLPACENNISTPAENPQAQIPNHIRINEVLASNKTTIKDPDYQQYADYIEIYNSSDKTIDISNFGLSDKIGGSIWRFPPATTIKGKDFILIWADDKNSGLHTNFKLSSDGDNVILYDTKQTVLDKITFQAQDADISITKGADDKQIFIKPTPKKENLIATNEIIDDTIQTPTSDIYINELMARNTHTVMDSDFYAFSDWIELYNNSNHDISLSNYKLSNSTFQNGWSILANTPIPAKGYMILFADKKDTSGHSNFSLSDTGESLMLYAPNGDLLDKVNFKKQKIDISYGRDTTNKHWGYMSPSFKQQNASSLIDGERSKKPTFSFEGGFYNTSKTIAISTEDSGNIYYTTDGSLPDKDAIRYQNPIILNHTQVINAISYKEGFLPSKIQTQTYFINQESTLPIISLSINPDFLFDDEVGIYVEGTNGVLARYCGHINGAFNYGNAWARPAQIEYYDKDKQKAFSLWGDLSISGACSRINAKKSFSFELEKKYSTKVIEYPLYDKKENISITDLRIRTGSDGYMITDMLAASLVESGNLNIDYQAFRISKMYVNGNYWGVYHIREKKGKGFINSNYPNVDKQNIDIMSAGKIKAGDRVDYDSLYTYLQEHQLSVEANYQNVLSKIDIDNYIDYMCMMIFSGAQDWINNNTRLWKEKVAGSKWRWILDDVDGSFIAWRANSDNFQLIKDRPTRLTSALFISLSENINFKNRFKQRFNELLDTVFTPTNILQHTNNIADQQQAYMHLEKWGAALSRHEKTIEEFVEQADEDIESTKTFAVERRGIVKIQLNNY